jgi:phosphomannomutase / phosphoglucomutase
MFPNRKVSVGRDGRVSSVMLLEGVVAGVLAHGNDVDDYGLITTPALEFSVKNSMSSVGIMITASHNPPEYNGFKVVDSDGIEIPRPKEERMERLIARNVWRASRRSGSRREIRAGITAYLDKIEEQIDSRDQAADLKIVVDTGNGVSALTTLELLRKIGADVIAINDEIDGNFPGRNSEPRPENLGALVQVVRKEGADLGIAHDGDGDRAIFVDEKGEVIPGDRSLALIEDDLLTAHLGAKVVTPINTSMVVSEVAQKRKGKLILTKVGSIEVSRTVVREGALLGGEENGGIFYAPHHPVRDGTMAAVLMINSMIKNRKPLSHLLAQLPTYYMVKEKIACKEGNKEKAIRKLKAQLKDRITSTLDGVRADLKDRGWILVRASGTEPLVRLYAEAKTEKQLRGILDEYRPVVLSALK